MTNRVLCLRPEADFARVNALPPASLAVTYGSPADPELPDRVKQSDALVIPAIGPKIPAELFERTSVRIVQVTGAGVDRLDPAAMIRLGIPVCNVAGGSNAAVSEYCVAAASALLRRMAWSDAQIKAGNYASFRARMLTDNLAGIDRLTVGIVGFGTIGRAVANAFQQMGCAVRYFDPAAGDAGTATSAEAVSLDDLLRTSDVVTLHVPLLPETTNLIGAPELAKMKKTAVLVQASRGGVVDEAALAAALTAGHIAGAAVDVYSTEPPPADNPLLMLTGEAASRLLLTPHIAGVTRQSSAFLFTSSWQNVERVLLRGEAPINRVY